MKWQSRSAFQDLLAKSGRKAKPPLTLVPEYRIERARGSSVIVDGALVDLYHLPHGYWEAKDEKDDLAKEVQFKLDKGYPRDNIIFQAPGGRPVNGISSVTNWPGASGLSNERVQATFAENKCPAL